MVKCENKEQVKKHIGEEKPLPPPSTPKPEESQNERGSRPNQTTDNPLKPEDTKKGITSDQRR